MLKTTSIRLLRGLIKALFGSQAWSMFLPVIALFFKMKKENGYQYTIKYFKALRLCITRYICGKPLLVHPERIALKGGFPVKLMYLKEYIDRRKPQGLRLILTFLQFSKFYVPTRAELNEAEPDYSTITGPYKGKEWTIPWTFVRDFVKVYNLKSPYPEYNVEKHYYSMKGSPFGKASIGSLRVTELSYPILGALYRLFRYNTQWFSDFYTKVWESKNLCKQVGTPSGKLSIVEDSELKKRVIAMVDYHSQYALRPIHDRIMSLLRHFPSDRTFTQDPYNNWQSTGRFHSLDLSSATDRFPVKLQVKLLSYIYDRELALAWRDLLLNRDYATPDGRLLRYSVGQPMGAYSSWAVFSLTHHLVVAYAAHRCGHQLGTFTDYILLGDDIVIKDNKVAQRYTSIMTRLGVDISMAKTHVSKDTYEFAKRWISAGTEITGLPLKGIGSNLSNYRVIYMLLYSYYEKVPGLYRGDLVDLVAKIYDRFSIPIKGKKSAHPEERPMRGSTTLSPKGKVRTARYLSFGKVRESLHIFSVGVKFSRGVLRYDELRNIICRTLRNSADFMFPNESEWRDWFKSFLSHGLADHIQSANRKILSINEPLIKGFTGDLDVVRESPLVIGISNHITQSIEALSQYIEGDGKDVFDIASKVSLIDPTAILSRTSKVVAVVDSVMSKSLKNYMPKDGIIYYGSSMGSSSVDTSYLIQSSIWNMEFGKARLEEIRDLPETPELDAWGRPVT
nr:RNA-dependent RNA polymerase [Phomopsis viticola mitovirus 961]